MSRVGAWVWSFGTSWLELGLVSTDCTSSLKATPTPSADPEQGAPSRSGIWKHCLRNTGAEGGPRSEAWTTAGGWLLSATQTYPADRDWGPAGPGICRFARSDQELAYEYISI